MEKIKSIEELIKFYLTNEIEDEEKFREKILELIEFEIKYNDEKLKAEITPPYTFMLQSYQESIYLGYLAISGKREDLRFLKQEEREALNVKFKLKPGSNRFTQAFENPDLLKGIFEKMSGEQIIIFISIIFGYLTITEISKYFKNKNDNEKEIKTKEIEAEREKKLYETFQNITETLPDKRNFEEKKEEALLTPLIAYKNNELQTQEVTIDYEQVQEIIKSKKQQLNEKETIIKEGYFYVDGIKNATNENVVTYYLKNDDEEIKIDVENKKHRAFLFQNIGKIIFAKIEIIKENKIVKDKKILDLKDKEQQ
jgi:hypothetical protein